jgi:predicted lipoprotein
MLTAADGNDAYHDAEEAAKDLLKSLHAALDLAIAAKLETPLGESIEKARPKRLESWRSELSLANIHSNLATAWALYEAAGGFGAMLEAEGGGAELDQAIRQRFERSFELIDGIGVPLEHAIAEPEPRAKVLELLAELQALRRTVRNELAPGFGLVLGFNATDGD